MVLRVSPRRAALLGLASLVALLVGLVVLQPASTVSETEDNRVFGTSDLSERVQASLANQIWEAPSAMDRQPCGTQATTRSYHVAHFRTAVGSSTLSPF